MPSPKSKAGATVVTTSTPKRRKKATAKADVSGEAETSRTTEVIPTTTNAAAVTSHATASKAAAPPAAAAKPKQATALSSSLSSSQASGGRTWYVVAVVLSLIVLVVVALAMCGLDAPQPQAPVTNACGCAAASHRTLSGPWKSLVGSLLRQREGVNGMQVHTTQTRAEIGQWLANQVPCAKAVVVKQQMSSVAQLAETLRRPFPRNTKQPTCVVWLASDDSITPVANSLKELLEKNTLQGQTVVPAGSHGVLLLVSQKDREELKATLPHRVVHMFSPLELGDAA